MKLPLELRDTIIVLSVDSENVLDIWDCFRGIKWTYYLGSTREEDYEVYYSSHDDHDCYSRFILKQHLPEEFIHHFKEDICWRVIKQKFSEEFIIDYKDHFWFCYYLKYHKISEDTLEILINTENVFCESEWETISEFQDLSEDFIRRYHSKLDWDLISEFQVLSEEFLEEFRDLINWDSIYIYESPLSEEFVLRFDNYLNLYLVFRFQRYPESFIRHFLKESDYRLEWRIVSECQDLSEDFIREFQDFIDWKVITSDQTFSEDFIREFQDRIDWELLSTDQTFPEYFIEEFRDLIGQERISRYNVNNTYTKKEYKFMNINMK
jgi:hypothetical protein